MSWKEYEYTARFNGPGKAEYSYRPMVKISVAASTGSENFMALIDSGSEITMMSSEIADILEISPAGCKTGVASGLGGNSPGFFSKVNIQIPEFPSQVITTNVLFIKDLSFDILLGQDDFFRTFLVRFEKHKNKFYLEIA